MPAIPQFSFELLQFRSHAFSHRLPEHDELAVPRLAARMRKAKKVKSLGLAFAPPFPIFGRKASEFDQASLVGMQFQSELAESLLQIRQEPFGIRAMLESHYEVIRKAHDDDVAP